MTVAVHEAVVPLGLPSLAAVDVQHIVAHFDGVAGKSHHPFHVVERRKWRDRKIRPVGPCLRRTR